MKIKTYKAILIITALAGVFSALVFGLIKSGRPQADTNVKVDVKNEVSLENETSIEKKDPQAETVTATDKKEITTEVGTKNKEVPFTSQAPIGKWDESVFEDGCEEASVIMAVAWARGSSLTKENVEKQLRDLAELEKNIFGHAVDTSAADTARFAKVFDPQLKMEVKNVASAQDLKNELAKGNIILAGAFGRALKNPHFTQPGPVEHMLVIIGYDEKTGEFIVNDPGTKFGEKYRYAEKTLFDALWDYPTGGKHVDPPVGKLKKSMIIVSP